MEALVDQPSLFAHTSCAKETQDPVSDFESYISPVFLLLVGFLEEEESNGQADQDDKAADDVWQQIRKLVKNGVRFEISRVVANWIRKCTTETSSDDASVKS